MSRSTYIYVVQNHDLVIGAWTVKHELESWLSQGERRSSSWQLTRHRDGQPWVAPVVLDKNTLEPAT